MTVETTGEEDSLARLWNGYATKVYGDYSPLNSALSAAVASDAELLGFVRRCPPHAHDPNMLLAAVQYVVLAGSDHPLAALYREPGADLSAVPHLLSDFWCRHEAELSHLMATRHIQTNEVGRAPGLALGLIHAAAQIGEPIGLIDDGASAGLNLVLDEYHLDFGAPGSLGPDTAPVRISCELQRWAGPFPSKLPHIDRRIGIDREPVDLGDESNTRWLLACIWPGTGRQDRARAAMRLMAGRPCAVRHGDMVADLGPAVAELGPGPVVVVTSWSFSYLPEAERTVFQEVLYRAGKRQPVAWVCCDSAGLTNLFTTDAPPPTVEAIPSVLGMAVYDRGGVRSTALGYMHSHGAWIEWLGGSMPRTTT